MAEISEAAVGRLAVELALKDGFAWQLEFLPPSRLGTKIEGRPLTILDEEGRQKYRALARQQLERECGDA
jgi:hypothetical protein